VTSALNGTSDRTGRMFKLRNLYVLSPLVALCSLVVVACGSSYEKPGVSVPTTVDPVKVSDSATAWRSVTDPETGRTYRCLFTVIKTAFQAENDTPSWCDRTDDKSTTPR
jgi:hypothetical protein